MNFADTHAGDSWGGTNRVHCLDKLGHRGDGGVLLADDAL
jgi:hypothetical protein